MNLDRWTSISAAVLTGGALTWLAKLAVIAATDGRVTDTGLAAICFAGGFVALLVGSTTIGARLTRGRPWLARAAAVAVSPLLFLLSFVVLEGIGRDLIGDAGPPWLADEVGILLAAAVWLAIGLALLRRPASSGSQRRAARDRTREGAVGSSRP